MNPRVRQALATTALLSAALGFAGVAAEVAIRLATRVSSAVSLLFYGSDPLAILVEPHGELGYRQRPGSTYHYANGTSATSNASGFRGPDVGVSKPAGTFRIVLLGGSTSHGWGVNDSSTIDAHMRTLLSARWPGRKFEVINLAFDGYDSWQDFERLRSDGIPRTPDLVILNSGINDVRNARYPHLVDRDPRTLLWSADMERLRREQERGGPSAWTLVKHYSYLARLGGIVRDRLTEPAKLPPPTPAPVAVAVTAYPEAAEYFQRNVGRIAELSGSNHIPLLLSTPPSSLRLPGNKQETSGRTYWVGDAEATQNYRDELDRRLRRVADSLNTTATPVVYVPHILRVEQFLDDCHLTSDGNHQMAADFVAAAAPFIDGAATIPATTSH